MTKRKRINDMPSSKAMWLVECSRFPPTTFVIVTNQKCQLYPFAAFDFRIGNQVEILFRGRSEGFTVDHDVGTAVFALRLMSPDKLDGFVVIEGDSESVS